MRTDTVTTPVGRRPMTLALVKRQFETADIKPGKAVEKWKVFRDACEARVLLGVQDRALAVLDALLTFYPHQSLSEDQGLVVFPSNAQLSIRAHGITGTTLRRHLAALVEAGLIIRKDSPNGKRYARKDGSGEIEKAFGFSLAPLLARSEELALLAQQVAAERKRYLSLKEELTICRRDIRKLISAAIAEDAEGAGDGDGIWFGYEARLTALIAALPRGASADMLAAALQDFLALRLEIVNRLEKLVNLQKTATNDVGFGRHIQNSNTQPIHELEPAPEKSKGDRSGVVGEVEPADPPRLEVKAAVERANPAGSETGAGSGRGQQAEGLKAFPLGLVLQACPEIVNYSREGAITGWRDLMAAAVVVRSMLGVSPSAYQDACDAMGPENAAVAVACILERAGQINSPGGYLRDLTARARRGEFSLGPMLMALLRAHGGTARRA